MWRLKGEEGDHDYIFRPVVAGSVALVFPCWHNLRERLFVVATERQVRLKVPEVVPDTGDGQCLGLPSADTVRHGSMGTGNVARGINTIPVGGVAHIVDPNFVVVCAPEKRDRLESLLG